MKLYNGTQVVKFNFGNVPIGFTEDNVYEMEYGFVTFIRMICSLCSNIVLPALMTISLPLLLSQSESPLDFMLNAVATQFLIELDDLPEPHEYIDVDVPSDIDAVVLEEPKEPSTRVPGSADVDAVEEPKEPSTTEEPGSADVDAVVLEEPKEPSTTDISI